MVPGWHLGCPWSLLGGRVQPRLRGAEAGTRGVAPWELRRPGGGGGEGTDPHLRRLVHTSRLVSPPGHGGSAPTWLPRRWLLGCWSSRHPREAPASHAGHLCRMPGQPLRLPLGPPRLPPPRAVPAQQPVLLAPVELESRVWEGVSAPRGHHPTKSAASGARAGGGWGSLGS